MARRELDPVDQQPVHPVVVAEGGQAVHARSAARPPAPDRRARTAPGARGGSFGSPSSCSRERSCSRILRSASRMISGRPTRGDDDLRQGHVGRLEGEEQERQRQPEDAENQRLAKRVGGEDDGGGGDRDQDQRGQLQRRSRRLVLRCAARPRRASLRAARMRMLRAVAWTSTGPNRARNAPVSSALSPISEKPRGRGSRRRRATPRTRPARRSAGGQTRRASPSRRGRRRARSATPSDQQDRRDRVATVIGRAPSAARTRATDHGQRPRAQRPDR